MSFSDTKAKSFVSRECEVNSSDAVVIRKCQNNSSLHFLLGLSCIGFIIDRVSFVKRHFVYSCLFYM